MSTPLTSPQRKALTVLRDRGPIAFPSYAGLALRGRLESKGLVCRIPDPERGWIWAVSEEGLEALGS